MTVVETAEFLRSSAAFWTEPDRDALVNFLATNPEAGDVIAGTGGVRKIRWAVEGRGKRGGARVIYFYYSASLPLFLLSAYAKNQKANLSQAERNEMRRLVPLIVESYATERQD